MIATQKSINSSIDTNSEGHLSQRKQLQTTITVLLVSVQTILAQLLSQHLARTRRIKLVGNAQ